MVSFEKGPDFGASSIARDAVDQTAEHAEGQGAAHRLCVAGALAAPYLLVSDSAS